MQRIVQTRSEALFGQILGAKKNQEAPTTQYFFEATKSKCIYLTVPNMFNANSKVLSAQNIFITLHDPQNGKKFEIVLMSWYWAFLKARCMAHMENGEKSAPFESYGRSDKVC